MVRTAEGRHAGEPRAELSASGRCGVREQIRAIERTRHSRQPREEKAAAWFGSLRGCRCWRREADCWSTRSSRYARSKAVARYAGLPARRTRAVTRASVASARRTRAAWLISWRCYQSKAECLANGDARRRRTRAAQTMIVALARSPCAVASRLTGEGQRASLRPAAERWQGIRAQQDNTGGP